MAEFINVTTEFLSKKLLCSFSFRLFALLSLVYVATTLSFPRIVEGMVLR